MFGGNGSIRSVTPKLKPQDVNMTNENRENIIEVAIRMGPVTCPFVNKKDLNPAELMHHVFFSLKPTGRGVR